MFYLKSRFFGRFSENFLLSTHVFSESHTKWTEKAIEFLLENPKPFSVYWSEYVL